MTCPERSRRDCPAETTLLLFAEKLDDSCRSHVETCDGCRATVSELEQTILELRYAAPVATNHAVQRLMGVRTSARPPAGPRRLFFAAAAVILIATGVSIARLSTGTRPKNPPPTPITPAKPEPARRDESAEMIGKALAWLSNNQKPDGSFGSVGLTGLALQAYFGAGHGENSEQHSRAVRSAIASLLGQQGVEGQYYTKDGIKQIYDHAIATWAMVEAVGDKHCADPRARQSAEKAIGFLVAAQNPGKGWRYSPKCGDNDTSVTFWAASALVAARRAGFTVPDACFDGARAWIHAVTDPNTMSVGYNARGTGKVYIPGNNEAYHHHQTLAAAAMAFRLLAGDARDAAMVAAIGFLVTDPPSAATVEHQDYYYWHLGAMAFYLYEGAESPLWKDWHARLMKALAAGRQEDGSWKANDRWGKDETTGPVYATAINALTLETTRRFAGARK